MGLGGRPYAEDTANDWVELLEKLRTQPIQSKLGYCPLYIRVDVIFLGSDVEGGEWIRLVESEVRILQRSGFPPMPSTLVYANPVQTFRAN